MDMNGDLKIDLFGVTSQSSLASFKVWQNVWNSSNPHSDIFDMCVVHGSRTWTSLMNCNP